MKLDDLVTHLPAQTLIIQELIGILDLLSDSGPTPSAWAAFRNPLWTEKPASLEAQEGLERDDDPFSYPTPITCSATDIPETIPTFWKLRTSPVTGQLGWSSPTTLSAEPNLPSVKYVFSILLLMRWPTLKLPKALQVGGGYAILFHKGDTSRLPHLDIVVAFATLGLPFNNRGRLCALADSNRSLIEPVPLYRHYSPFLVAQPVFPRPKRFERTERVHFETWYVKSRAFSEVLQAYVISHRSSFVCSRPFITPPHYAPYPLDRRLRHLYDMYGAPPRSLSEYTNQPDEYGAHVTARLQFIRLDDLQAALQSPDFNDFLRLIRLIELSSDSRSLPETSVASQGAPELLWAWNIPTISSSVPQQWPPPPDGCLSCKRTGCSGRAILSTCSPSVIASEEHPMSGSLNTDIPLRRSNPRALGLVRR